MIKNDASFTLITIPEHELEITASKSGGPGGQHVNKTSSRISVRWNVKNSTLFDEEQKQRILEKLAPRLTTEGDLIVHNSSSRSQQHNKKMALKQLEEIVRKALHVPKKRKATRISQAVKESHLQEKAHRGLIKKMRNKNSYED